MKNVLLTGSSGFLGEFIKIVFDRDYSLFTLSRTLGNYKFSLENGIPKFNQTFDLVIHAAGKAHIVPKNEKDEKEFHQVNVMGTENLLKGLEKIGVPKQFVFISSVAVYGKEIGQNINETFSLDAIDAYGLSKIKAEQVVLEWCQKNNVIYTILRLPLLVGKNPPGNLGAMIKSMKRGYYFNIGGGHAKKSMVLAEDVAAYIPKVATVGGIYNLTDGVHPTFRELSGAIAKQQQLNLPLALARLIAYLGDFLGNKAPINSLKLKKIITYLTFDDSKARTVFGWNPQSVIDYLENNDI